MSSRRLASYTTPFPHNVGLDDDDIAGLMDRADTTKQSSEDSPEHDGLTSLMTQSDIAESDGVAGTQVETTETTGSFIPWYLQQGETVSDASRPTAAGQDMPEMPEHAPSLLEPITKHTLEVLGLTHLKILDLREMTDPPPALGANLIMVIGTARSERHLHASADKLCRWIRTEHKMTPFADGLLGRNEMKIAIRRRARRAKMMSAVGAKTVDSGDLADGLRSGWICVNVGRVQGGVLPEHAEASREIIGFGTTNDSTTLVVQMLTEEKREEINLEELWSRSLDRQIRRKKELLQQAEEFVEGSASVQSTSQLSS